MIPKEKVAIGKTVVIRTQRKGLYWGTVVEKDADGFFSRAINDEIIFIPYDGIS
jgi:hypothetical protein